MLLILELSSIKYVIMITKKETVVVAEVDKEAMLVSFFIPIAKKTNYHLPDCCGGVQTY